METVDIGWFDPGHDGEPTTGANVERRASRNSNARTGSIERKSLTDFAGRKRNVRQLHFVSADRIGAAAFALPERDQAGRQMSALDFRVTKPTGDEECAENNHRAGDDRNYAPCPHLCGNRRLSGGIAGIIHLWRNYWLVAGRAIDLLSGIAGVALDLPTALRAMESEFRHLFCWL